MTGIVAPVPNQSYFAKQMQGHLAAALACLMYDLGANCNALDNAWRSPFKTLFQPGVWRIDNQFFTIRRTADKAPGISSVRFSKARWDPEHSSLDYGTKKAEQKVNEHAADKTKLIQNKSDTTVHVSYEESIGLTNAFSSSVTKGVSLDMSAEIASEQKVSGSYAGVSAEVSLSEKFGISKSSSKEESKEQSEEGTKDQSLGIEFDAEPRNNYLVEISKENETTTQPFDIDGVMDFAIHLSLRHNTQGRNGRFRPTDQIDLSSIDDLMQMVFGYDTRFPKMEGYWAKAPDRVQRAMDYISKPENRRIQVSGINHESLDSNATYNVEQLGHAIPGEFAHLPVVDAQEYADAA